MASNGCRDSVSIHATAVALAGEGLLIIGPSRAGKSHLARALIALSTRRLPILLIGDDRILLSRHDGGVVARGHPRIQGFVERRGLGIEAVPFTSSAPVRRIVDLGPNTPRPPMLENFPSLSIVTSDGAASRRDVVLRWWRGSPTTPGDKTARPRPARC